MFFAGYDHRHRKPRVFRVKMSKDGVKSRASSEEHKQDEICFCNTPQFFGSGSKTANSYLEKGKTAFDCLKSTILSKKVNSVGGVPQVVRIDASGVQPIGVVWDKTPYLFGMALEFRSKMEQVEWRDKGFKECVYPKAAKVTRVGKKK